MGKMPAWVPAGPATYGGHVYTQAAWAASQTVEEGFVVHVWYRWPELYLSCAVVYTLYTNLLGLELFHDIVMTL